MQEGLSEPAREYFARLHQIAQGNGGGVRVDPTGWHSKLYVADATAFIGSSNLTEHGLSDWTEANLLVSGEQSDLVRREAQRLYESGIAFDAAIDEVPHREVAVKPGKNRDSALFMPAEPSSNPTPGVEISLLDSSGLVAAKSGLNWGLAGGRPRDRYECYIRFPISVHEEAKFVFGSIEKGTEFIANTHDGKTFRLRLEGNSQAGESTAKQISTSGDKRVLGRWMVVDCLGITDGRAVTLADLNRYGRTSVAFYRTSTTAEGLAVVYLDFARRR